MLPQHIIRSLLATLTCLVCLGCQRAAQDGPASPSTTRTVDPTVESASANKSPEQAAPDAADFSGISSEAVMWDRIEMSGKPVGYQATTLRQVSVGDSLVRDGTAISRLTVQRFGEVTTEQMQLASRETTSGQVVRVEAKLSSGDSEQHVVGERRGNQIHWQASTAGRTQRWETAAPADCGGFFAVEWSLLSDPMQPGQTRQLNAIVPVINQAAEIRLSAGRWTNTDGNGPAQRRLLPIQQSLTLPGATPMEATLWVDETGHVWRSELPALRQQTFRTDRATALAAASEASFDLGSLATIRLPKPIAGGHQVATIRYKIHLSGGDPSQYFRTTDGQSVSQIDADTIAVVVRRIRPGETSAGESTEQVAAEIQRALATSALVQTDDQAVRALAAQIRPLPAATATNRWLAPDAWQLACEIERFVGDTVADKNFSTALASAGEVARQRQGDCTEHAVLCAALCRIHRLPARVLLGLVYVPSSQAFVFHMWNEVRIGSQWIPLDATLGLGGTGAAHLILARSELASENAFTAFLPVMNVIGQLSIEQVDVLEP